MRIAAGFAALLLLTGFGFQARPLTGTVIDMKTGRPLPGAIVVARWFEQRADLAHARRVCYHVETVAADAAGRFTTPAWNTGVRLRDPSAGPNQMTLDAFMPGYATPFNVPMFQNQRLLLTPFEGMPGEYAASVDAIRQRLLDCGRIPKNAPEFAALASALDAEGLRHPYQRAPSTCANCAQR